MMIVKILILSLILPCQIHACEKPESPVSPKLLPDRKITYAEVYPLHAAAYTNNTSAIYDLVQNEAIPTEISDHVGYTPLHYAAAQGHLNAASALLTLGAEVHVKATCGQTPIKLARLNNHHELAEFLYIYELTRRNKDKLPRVSPINLPDKK
jgi:cytohesin